MCSDGVYTQCAFSYPDPRAVDRMTDMHITPPQPLLRMRTRGDWGNPRSDIEYYVDTTDSLNQANNYNVFMH